MTRPPRQIDRDAEVLARPADHQPQRPGWDCTQGDGPWPCARYREHLLATLDRGAIGSLMGGWYPQMLAELREGSVVHARLFGWYRHEGMRRPAGGPW